MFSMFDIAVVIIAIVVAGILWKTIKLVAKIVIILAIAWVLLKVFGVAPSVESDSVAIQQIEYMESV